MGQASPYPAGHPYAGKLAHTRVTQAQSRKCEALRKHLTKNAIRTNRPRQVTAC